MQVLIHRVTPRMRRLCSFGARTYATTTFSCRATMAELPTSRGISARLRGRAFYESIGSPKYILAPMVDQSEFAWRMLSRSFMRPEDKGKLLAYTPMFHARLFGEAQQYRDSHFQPTKAGLPGQLPSSQSPDRSHDFLDGRPDIDRPLTVQFCSNDPDEFLEAAKYVQPFCDAVDLNLGCPQGIARKGHYGAFLQEDWGLIARMISKLNDNLDVPVTAKMRVLETKEKTLEYARMIVDAGASILTVHGRLREQKGHMTGLADWKVIRYLRDNLPKELVMFANGNILRHEDIQRCLEETGVDGVMSAEGNLSDPTIFAVPPAAGEEGREYWRGRDGKGGFRMDAVFRRYLDIIYEHVLKTSPPDRKPLYLPSDKVDAHEADETAKDDAAPSPLLTAKRPNEDGNDSADQPPKKKRKGGNRTFIGPNFSAMQPHLFHLLKPLVSVHTNVRDALAKSRGSDIEVFENVLALTEQAVKQGLQEYETNPEKFEQASSPELDDEANAEHVGILDYESSARAVRACKRPYWICQPYIRPLPNEAVAKGALSSKTKALQKLKSTEVSASQDSRAVPEGSGSLKTLREKADAEAGMKKEEVAQEAMVAG